MSDRRDGELLHDGGRAEQGSRGHEKDVAKPPRAHAAQDVSAQHRGAAAAARASRVNVLSLAEDHDPAVLVTGAEIDALVQQKVIQQSGAYPAQIAGVYHVVVISVGISSAKIPPYGVRRSRC